MGEKKRYIEVPTTWDELTTEDWIALLRMRQQIIDQQLKVTVGDVRTETARVLLQHRGLSLQLSNQAYLALVAQVADTLDWLWQVRDGGLSLTYRSTINLLPKLYGWTGPKSHGEDLLFGEFREAVAHLKVYETDGNDTALCALAGLLYRPKATKNQHRMDGLNRLPWNFETIDYKIKRGQQMKAWQRWGIYAWMAYFCEYLATGTFIIDGQEVCFAPIFEATGDGGSSKQGGLSQIRLTLAESGVFGTIREVDQTPLLTVMQKLLMDYEALQRIKRGRIKN